MIEKIIYDTAANCTTRRGRGEPGLTMFENDWVAGAATVSVLDLPNPVHRSLLTLAAFPITLTDVTNVGGGAKIFTFPEGRILVHGAVARVAVTTTSVLASTLNTGVTLSVGVGSVQTTTQGSGTLATTQQDIVNAFSATASATINVAGAVANGKGPSAPLSFDGTSTAQPVWLNIGVPTATDIDGDATVTVTGTVEIIWSFIGDY